jgi:hypothetical protein
VAPKKPVTRKSRPEATIESRDARPRRRGSSGSVARSLLEQAPQATQQNAAGFMRPAGIDSFERAPETTVRPAPATGVGDPDRQPQTPRRRRTRARGRRP